MQEAWQNALGKMTYGIYTLTTRHETAINGMIASWVTQISHDPPLIMVAVHPNRYSHRLIEKSGAFALHVLERSQKELLKRFKGPEAAAKFSDLLWEPGRTGSPILSECLAWLDCRVTDRQQPGNHTLFTAEIITAGPGSLQGTPLCTLDYEGMYTGKA
jgi:flavin reductase (DIM6/NTAB) family NADH-FMN oxidoreductase RutF